jgi:hypothetical protein
MGQSGKGFFADFIHERGKTISCRDEPIKQREKLLDIDTIPVELGINGIPQAVEKVADIRMSCRNTGTGSIFAVRIDRSGVN